MGYETHPFAFLPPTATRSAGPPRFDRRRLGAHRRRTGPGQVAPRRAARAGRPHLRRGRAAPGPHRRALARPAQGLRQLGRRLPALPPLGTGRPLAGPVRARRRRPGADRPAALRQHRRPRPPARRRRAKKKGGQAAQALGKSRGGWGTKVHLAAADERTAVAVVLTPGQQGDATVFDELLGAVPRAVDVEHGVADKAYDSDAIRWALLERDAAPVIPSNASRTELIPHDARLYRERNRVERLVGKLKQFRRIATRYEKLACTFLALLHLVAAFIKFR